jgi:hypothetical protein
LGVKFPRRYLLVERIVLGYPRPGKKVYFGAIDLFGQNNP